MKNGISFISGDDLGMDHCDDTAQPYVQKEQIPGTKPGKRAPRSTDGHTLHGIRDITCRQFGHNHPEWEEPTTRYIVHDDIEDGFIILNGKKMLRTEADQYENTI